MNNSLWLDWARRLALIAQSSLAYCTNPYDIERFQQVREIAVEILANQTNASLPEIRDLLENERGYATPKVDCRGVIFYGPKILLVRERADQNRWTLPGGWVDMGEPPSTAVEREVWEESGFEVKATKLLAIFDNRFRGHPQRFLHTYKLMFRCEITGGEPRSSFETDGAEFFAEDAIPELSISRTTEEEIARMFIHYHNPDLPTDFD